jgi:hypothetical protein
MPVLVAGIFALTKKRARLLAAVVIVPMACVLLLALIGPLRIHRNMGTETSPTEFAQARHRWETRTPSHYRLVASYSSNSPECRQEVEVQDERVVRVLSNECAPTWTFAITDIFDLFEPLVGTDPTQRSRSGPCSFFVVDAVYDDRLGYPLRIESREFQGIHERGRYLSYRAPECWLNAIPAYRVIVETLQFLP